MLELFSSEGCSSCPPADQWMAKLEKHPRIWKSFVPVAFHVDYWNRADWNDELSDPQMTERQKAHARTWENEAVYTPAFVLNGAEWGDWMGSSAPPSRRGDRSGTLVIRESGKGFKVVFTPENKKLEDLTIHIALLGIGINRKISAGENKGVALTHSFVVMDWRNKFVMKPVSGKFSAEFPGLTAKLNPSRTAVVAWVQMGSAPKPIQATGAFRN